MFISSRPQCFNAPTIPMNNTRRYRWLQWWFTCIADGSIIICMPILMHMHVHMNCLSHALYASSCCTLCRFVYIKGSFSIHTAYLTLLFWVALMSLGQSPNSSGASEVALDALQRLQTSTESIGATGARFLGWYRLYRCFMLKPINMTFVFTSTNYKDMYIVLPFLDIMESIQFL